MRQKKPFELLGNIQYGFQPHQSSVSLSIQQMEEDDAYMAVRVHFGRPSQECSNYGICFVESWKKYSEKEVSTESILPENWSKAFFLVKDARLHIFFLKKTMAPNTIKKHFGNGYFTIWEPFIFPPVFAKHCKQFPKFIKPMKYPIHQSSNYFSIIIS